jgi:hypothetical protein
MVGQDEEEDAEDAIAFDEETGTFQGAALSEKLPAVKKSKTAPQEELSLW